MKNKIGKLVKFMFKFGTEGKAAVVFDHEKNVMRFGGPKKFEMYMKELMKHYFNATEFILDNHREIKYRRKRVDKSGQVTYENRIRTNGRIVFRFKCPVWRFKNGYQAMSQLRSEGRLNFDEVESIGRILN